MRRWNLKDYVLRCGVSSLAFAPPGHRFKARFDEESALKMRAAVYPAEHAAILAREAWQAEQQALHDAEQAAKESTDV